MVVEKASGRVPGELLDPPDLVSTTVAACSMFDEKRSVF
jgi:hypothetical protein